MKSKQEIMIETIVEQFAKSNINELNERERQVAAALDFAGYIDIDAVTGTIYIVER